jgi:RNA polymerase sigma factor (sigma-70 family)
VTDHTDLLIVQKVLAGDTQAFAVLVDKYKDMAVNLAFNILSNREDAEEVAQDAFIKTYHALQAFKGDSRFSTWIYRIIINTALNKKKLKNFRFVEIENTIEETDNHSNNILSMEISAEQKKHIQVALQKLNANERICLTMYYLDELTTEEIHQVTGISISNIKVLLYRGRKHLSESLQQYLKSEIINLI